MKARARETGGGAQPDRRDRVDRARAILVEAGVEGRVRAVGMDGEIVAVAAASDALRRLEALAPDLRELGFQYVALEMEHEAATQ